MPLEQERIHRATRSTLGVGGPGNSAARSTTSMSPGRYVDSGLSGSQSSASATWACNQCSKIFNRRENLSRHLKTHDVSPSHRCSKCDKAFTRSDLLKRHELGHERWDKKDSTARSANASSKRRRVAFEDDNPTQASPNSPWTLEGQELAGAISSHEPHGNMRHVYPTNGQPLGGPKSLNTSSSVVDRLSPPDYRSIPATHTVNSQPQDGYHHAHQLSSASNTGLQEDQLTTFHHLDPNEQLPFGPFDFSSFLLPSDTGPVGNEWFSHDFYSAMRETGDEWVGLGLGELLDPNFMSPSQDHGFTPVNGDDQINPSEAPTQNEETGDASSEESDDNGPDHGRISRISSPPNEASEEDKWPFQWNPKSRPILKANAVAIPDHHPLLQNHNTRFDISETTLLRLRAFLNPPAGREFHQSQKGSLVLPSLPVINVFIGLFFEHFSPQMPIIHHPTVNTNADLPPPLLAAMITIGAIYSHLKHTRRFSIVLLDIVRWNLQIALECDNSLMREPMIIYAEALICHTGLWCGNKRAFELAEVVRGAVVTYIRRVHFLDRGNPITKNDPAKENLNTQWHRWIAEESQRRLYWVIYALDAQFPTLLNLPASIALGEITDLGCPCDEEFWFASSARNWKNLLGPALVPPSRSFSAAVGPFILSTSLKTPMNGRNSQDAHQLPVLDLNPWSAFLVLMTIQTRVFQLSHESLLSRSFIEEEYLDGNAEDDEHQTHGIERIRDVSSILKEVRVKRREQLADALSAWFRAYSIPPSRNATTYTSHYFHAVSIVVYHLSTILLDIELSDLQNAIGKDGTAGMSQAMSNLSMWVKKSPRIAENVAFNAVRTIVSLAPNRSIHEDSAPYSIVTLFLCHVVLWVFATVSPASQKQQLFDRITETSDLCSSRLFGVLKNSLSLCMDDVGERRTDAPKLLFKSGAEMLTQLGTWGASLNLALLIHRRAEMQ